MSELRKIIFTYFLLIGAISISSAGILKVGEKEQYSSIKTAIEAANPYDTVWVNAGHYNEHSLLIKKPITLLGQNRPVIDAQGEKVELFVVLSDSVVIDGFVLANVGTSYLKELSAIKVRKGRHGIIRNNTIKNCFFGIYLEYGKDFRLENNTIIGEAEKEASAGNAIHVWKGDRITILNNVATGHRDGIYFEFVNNSKIEGNLSYDNMRYGLHFMFSNNDEYIANEFRNNGSGVAVMFSRNIKMVRNLFLHNWGGASYGLLLKEISDGEIIGNKFISNTIGILAEGANRLRINGNQFTTNGRALDIKGNCLDNEFVGNNFLSNTFEVVTNSRYNLNTYDSNYWSHYKGFDLDRDGIGDNPHSPVSIFAKIIDEIPAAAIMLHSSFISVLELGERIFPDITPAELIDKNPRMKPISL